MVGAVLAGTDELADGDGEVMGVGGVADFIGDDFDLAGLAGALQDGVDEVTAVRGVEPGGADDVGFVPDGAGIEFTGRFGSAVGVGGIDRHPFFIGGGVPAVEHLIGADLHKGDVELLTGEREVLGAESVGLIGELWIFDAAINVGVCGAVDD